MPFRRRWQRSGHAHSGELKTRCDISHQAQRRFEKFAVPEYSPPQTPWRSVRRIGVVAMVMNHCRNDDFVCLSPGSEIFNFGFHRHRVADNMNVVFFV